MQHKRQAIGTNELLRFMSTCTDVDVLFSLMNDEGSSTNVKRRARHKLFIMWAERTEKINRSCKSRATREKNKLIAAKIDSEKDAKSIVDAAIRAAKVEQESKAKGSYVEPGWLRSLSV